jgi:phosphoribosylglycinamide formyltransferase-1
MGAGSHGARYPARVRIGVLASGSGTILQAIIDDGLRPEVVVVDRTCRATEVGRRAGIPTEEVPRVSFGAAFDRVGYTHQVLDALVRHRVELVVMAGFGTILDKPFFDAYPGRIMNTHPALLPAFPGWHAVEEALSAGVKVTGCTVHLATLEVDAGPILAQEAVPVLEGDTVERLHERIKATERRLYPRTIRQFVHRQGEAN